MNIPKLVDLSPLAERASKIAREVEGNHVIIVTGPPGAGRQTLAGQVAQELGDRAALILAPPVEDMDSPTHLLLQGSMHLGEPVIDQMVDATQSCHERGKVLLDTLEREEKVLVVHVHRLPSRRSQDGAEGEIEQFFSSWLGACLERPKLRKILLISPDDIKLLDLRHCVPYLTLDPPTPLATSLRSDGWGPYCEPASRLSRELGSSRRTPLQLRLMVGLVALGVSPREVVSVGPLSGKHGVWDLAPLQNKLISALQKPRFVELRNSVVRFLQARFGIPRTFVVELANPPPEHTPLLTDCIGYGEAEIRVPEIVREALLMKLPPNASSEQTETHAALAKHHEALDGAISPAQAAKQMRHWLEKVHHFGHGGQRTAAYWNALSLSSPEQIIDRAKDLSITHGEYLEAAALYERVLERQPKHFYAQHYLAYNLDCAGVRPSDVERGYRGAIEAKPTSLYANSRLIAFLITCGRLHEAEEEWQRARERIELNDLDVNTVVHHMHIHVAMAWLDAGEVTSARRVVDGIPGDLFERDGVSTALSNLRWRLEDAEESQRLGESVYPSSFPMRARWKPPTTASQLHDNSPMRGWFPGRVVEVSAKSLTLALAEPADDPSERVVFVKELSWEEWALLAQTSSIEPSEGDFLQIVEYEDGFSRVDIVPNHPPPWDTPRTKNKDPLRFLSGELVGSVRE